MHPIVLRGAKTHNLKGVDLSFEPGQLVAITGVSGAGKSSLAMDTLYAEGQRRFVESFSPYARQFLERLDRPPMERLEPIAAGVAVDRRAPIKSSRSTVATMADLEPFLSALFSREAVPMCATCGVLAVRTNPHEAAGRVIDAHLGERAIVTYPLRVDGAEAFLDVRESLLQAGYRRILSAGKARDLDDVAPSEVLADGRGHLEVIVDRVSLSASGKERLAAAVEAGWARGGGRVSVTLSPSETLGLTEGLSCPSCARTFDPPTPTLFSYQSPVGACAKCKGFGRTIGIDWNKVIPNEDLSIAQGAIKPWGGKTSQYERKVLKKYCADQGIPMDAPWRTLTNAQKNDVIEGQGTWSGKKYPGVKAWFTWLETKTYKMHVRVLLSRYRAYDLCAACGGKRLSETSLAYRVAGLDLGAWHALEIRDARARLDSLEHLRGHGKLAKEELHARLSYLERVGLGYLTLDRQARTLSGGEAQRVSLTAALGTALVGALFVLDEPTVGLHRHDIPPLVLAMRELAARGNTVLVIEHDPMVIAACDRVVELGPSAGAGGGRVMFDGTVEAARKRKDLATARALGDISSVLESSDPTRASMALTSRSSLDVVGARGNNLRGVDVRVPLGCVVAVTGPSGSGKSSLVEELLYREIGRKHGETIDVPLPHDRIDGLSLVRGVTLVDQAPLGRTSRGNPATYTGAWDRVRQVFAASSSAIFHGFGPGHFSFNVAGGRCEACAGEGAETIEMQFLADVSLTCPSCRGLRFQDEVLAVEVDGKSVGDVLSMTVAEALGFFAREPAIVRALSPLVRLGLGYLTLGQPLPTLSGGEAQRLKLARALAEVRRDWLFLLDEPSAGLHADEVEHVNAALAALRSAGASVVVVEHDLAIIGAADWVIELGPGAGREGGHVVAEGTPKHLSGLDTATGKALRDAAAGRFGEASKRSAKSQPSAMSRGIEVVNAREHNLKSVSTTIPHGELVVVTGPSGSGKSTLAFDVVFAEGQRRFLETLTPYARQFLPTLPRPDVDRVLGVPPAISLEQRTSRSGANSTVATVTEIAQYLRLLFAKVGTPHCPTCDIPIDARYPDDAFEVVCRTRGTGRLLAPVVVARKGTYLDVFNSAARAGIALAIVDGREVSCDTPPKLKKTEEHSIDLIVWSGKLDGVARATFDRALVLGKGAVKVEDARGRQTLISTARACPSCGTSVPKMDPRWFSFNTKQGQCELCEGAGARETEEGELVTCELCDGARLAPIPRAVRLAALRYHEATRMSVGDALAWVKTLAFTGDAAKIAEAPHRELARRLAFVEEVGLTYLALDRRAGTLSGGEMQRLRLAAQLGSGLTGALYVLDEPTVGLHPRDTQRLLGNLRALVRTGSTVLLVEHDADAIRAADHLIDLGPTGGRGGGRIVAEGPTAEVLLNPASPTGRALIEETKAFAALRDAVPVASTTAREEIIVNGARAHNLSIDEVRFPLGKLIVVAGVSGSGKSTLVTRILYPAVRRALGVESAAPLAHKKVVVPKSLERALFVDQSPIGRTPRSVPATFLGIFDDIRKLYAGTPDAKVRGFAASRFSFNTALGRCTVCDGQGVTSHEMSFLPNVTTVCEGCWGARFEPATLGVKYLGLDIGQVLDLSAEEALGVFRAHRRISAPLKVMSELGLGYLKIGQGSHTLSGGEAQRLKLAAELADTLRHKPSLYVLDEPTTGLHWSDVSRLIRVLHELVERGHTVVVIEHHPGVMATADWLIELGPDAGALGGKVVAAGPPLEVANLETATGKLLAELLGKKRVSKRSTRVTSGAPLS